MSDLSLLRIHNLAINGSFALEYLLHDNPNRARELMKDGIEFCSMIERGDQTKDTISGSELELWEFMQIMKRFFKPEELSEITKQAKEIKSKLSTILNGGSEHISEKEIRKMQHFFNHTSHPFLALAMSRMRRRF